jgi:hypothetical protein
MNGGAVLETGQSLLRAPPAKCPSPKNAAPACAAHHVRGCSCALAAGNWDTQKAQRRQANIYRLAALRAFWDLKLLRFEITVSEIPQR